MGYVPPEAQEPFDDHKDVNVKRGRNGKSRPSSLMGKIKRAVAIGGAALAMEGAAMQSEAHGAETVPSHNVEQAEFTSEQRQEAMKVVEALLNPYYGDQSLDEIRYDINKKIEAQLKSRERLEKPNKKTIDELALNRYADDRIVSFAIGLQMGNFRRRYAGPVESKEFERAASLLEQAKESYLRDHGEEDDSHAIYDRTTRLRIFEDMMHFVRLEETFHGNKK